MPQLSANLVLRANELQGLVDALIDHVRSIRLRKGCFADLLLHSTDPESGDTDH